MSPSPQTQALTAHSRQAGRIVELDLIGEAWLKGSFSLCLPSGGETDGEHDVSREEEKDGKPCPVGQPVGTRSHLGLNY